MRTALLAALVLVAVVAVSAQYGPGEERQALIQEAITEAKAHARQREAARKAKAQTASSGRTRISARHFKQMSKEARRQGEARELLDNMVRRAERKLAEHQRKSHAETQSAEARAEELANELFHRPGSMLTEEEISHMMILSECVPREEEAPNCFTPTFAKYRTINGVCNNLQNPFLGAADIALSRLVPSQYEDGISALRGGMQSRDGDIFPLDPFQPPNPSPRHIVQTVIRNNTEDAVFTHMLMQWGQFIDHDLSLSPELEDECPERAVECEFTDICEQIRVTDLDPVFGIGTTNNGHCIPFSRSVAVCADPNEPLVNRGFAPREQINVLTAFIDGSMVYGSDEELARRIRKFEGGLLLEGDSQPGKKPELPRITPAENVREDGEEAFVGCPEDLAFCFLAGEFRVNEQVVLTVMHTLLFREHNRVARELAKLNPYWNDEELYQEARKIVGAVIQKITYRDYLPLIFGKKVYDIVIGEYLGYDPRIDPGVANAFSTAAYRYGHTLIRPFFDRLGSGYQPINVGALNLLNAFFNPDEFRNSYGTDPLTRGLITQNSRAVDEFLSSALTNNLFRDQLDLASLNIQRGRDHGLPTYLTWQRYCASVFPELGISDFENALTLIRFLEVYGSLETLDLWIGGLAEENLPGSVLGATFACLFGITFSNVRDGDRFYYSRPGVFEPEQLASIRDHTLASIICDNGDDIDRIQKDVFKANQPRVPCSQIPRINLNLWKEEPCYFRVNVRPRSFKLPLRSFSRFDDPLYSFSIFNDFAPISRSNYATCMPVVCPKGGNTIEVAFYTSKLLKPYIGLNPNPNIAANLLSSAAEYHAKWPASIFGDPKTGVFKSLANCESSNIYTFNIDLLSSVQQDLDPEILELLQKQGEDETNPLSPGTDEEVPEDLRYILFGFDTNEPIAVQSKTPSATNNNDGEDSDAQLMSDLEEALKSLNV